MAANILLLLLFFWKACLLSCFPVGFCPQVQDCFTPQDCPAEVLSLIGLEQPLVDLRRCVHFMLNVLDSRDSIELQAAKGRHLLDLAVEQRQHRSTKHNTAHTRRRGINLRIAGSTPHPHN